MVPVCFSSILPSSYVICITRKNDSHPYQHFAYGVTLKMKPEVRRMNKLPGYEPLPARLPGRTIAGLRHESDAWKRLISFMMEENVYLKTRLSEALLNDVDPQTLSDMESYHARFVIEDELIRLLRDDIAAYEQLLNSGNADDTVNGEKIQVKLKKLRTGISSAEKYFEQLKATFYRYLIEKMQ